MEDATQNIVLNQESRFIKSHSEIVNNSMIVDPNNITKVLLIITFLLLVCHLAFVHFLGYYESTPHLSFFEDISNKLYGQFHLAADGNIPTYFSSCILAIASILLYVIYRFDRNQTSNWLYLSFIFLFLSIDESATLHETFGGIAGFKATSYMKEVPSYLTWAWVIPYSILTVFIGLYFLKFTLKLPRKTKILFYISGGVYVFAALFLELFEAHFEKKYGSENVVNQFLFPFEEILEMVGIIIFIHALLNYILLYTKQFCITLKTLK